MDKDLNGIKIKLSHFVHLGLSISLDPWTQSIWNQCRKDHQLQIAKLLLNNLRFVTCLKLNAF
jgi:hypothetical protein